MARCPRCGNENPEGSRFCNGCGSSLASEADQGRQERKIVTVVFADLVGFTRRAEQLDPEDVWAILAPYHARLRSVLERFGGTVEKFIGDAVMAVFGAPTARDDDPERAVRAAIAVRDAAVQLSTERPGLDLPLRIAVNTGEALVAVGARPSEGEAIAFGDVVNTTARLQEAAPLNGILVGEATYRATRRVIDYRVTESITARGKAQPVPVWEVIQARAADAQPRPGPLVGRRSELALLADALTRVGHDREPLLVTIVGSPGIGKSRLVAELRDVASAGVELIHWYQGRSLPYREGGTYQAFTEMVKAHAGVLETDTAEVAERKLAAAVTGASIGAGEVEWRISHLRPLLGLDRRAELQGDQRAAAFAAWRWFFESLARRHPLVLAFEDLQWADEGQLAFIDHVLEWASGSPILMVATARPELLDRHPDWGRRANTVNLALAPLSDDETGELITGLLEQQLPVGLRGALLTRAGGNPLYAEEYVRMLLDRHLVPRGEHGWHLQGGDLPLPESVQSVLAARLDALPSEQKQLVQDAAVVGEVFWVGAVEAVGGGIRGSIERELAALEDKEFVRRESASAVAGDGQFAFTHILVRDAALAQIPRAQLAQMHYRAAVWNESLASDRTKARAEQAAYHYLVALDLIRATGQETSLIAEGARRALRVSGDHALALNDFAAAGRSYRTALELVPEGDRDRPSLLLDYGRALFTAERQGAEVLAQARDGLLSLGDDEGAAEAAMMLGELEWIRGDWDAAATHWDQAAVLVAGRTPSRSTAQVTANLARFHMIAGSNREARRYGAQALAMARSLGLRSLEANTLSTIGAARVGDGDVGGIDDLEAGVKLADELNSPEAFRNLGNLSYAYGTLGDLRRNHEWRQRARVAAERFGLADGLRWVRAHDAEYLFVVGDWDEALAAAEAFIVEAKSSPHYLVTVCLRVRASVRMARGAEADAVADATAALDVARGAQHPSNLLVALPFYARCLFEAGRRDDADAAISETLMAAAGTENFLEPIVTAIVMSGLGRQGEFLEVADRITIPSTRRDVGRVIARGDLDAAADLLARMEHRSTEAYVRLMAGARLVAQGRRREATSQLAQALAFHRSVGATAYVRRGEQLAAAATAD